MLRHRGNSEKHFIFFTDMILLVTVISDVISLTLTYLGVSYYVECSMAGLIYPTLANNSPELMTSHQWCILLKGVLQR